MSTDQAAIIFGYKVSELADCVVAGVPLPAEILSMTISRRAMVAAAIERELGARRSAIRAAIRKHRARVRAETPDSARRPCRVCGRFRPITERHHLKPVGSQRPGDEVDTRTVWLCPNCHRILHHLAAQKPADEEFDSMLTESEWEVMVQLTQETMRGGQ